MNTDSSAEELYKFYIAGIGSIDGGKDSAYAWVETKTKTSEMRQSERLSDKEAIYMAFSTVVQGLPPGSEAFVFTNSLFLRRRFNSPRWKHEIIVFPSVEEVTYQTIEAKKLKIHMEKVERRRNPAWKLLIDSREVGSSSARPNMKGRTER